VSTTGGRVPPTPGAREVGPGEMLAILKLFVAAGRNTRLYPAWHPTVRAGLDALSATVAPAVARRGAIRYDVWGGTVLGNRQPLLTDAVFVAEFAADAAARGVGSLNLLRGVTRDELARAAALFAMQPEELVAEGGLVEAPQADGITHIVFGPSKMWGATDEDISRRTVSEAYQWAARAYLDVSAAARSEGTLDPLRAQFVVESLLDMLTRSRAEVFRLIAGAEHEEASPYHAVNVALLCLALGARAGTPDRALRAIGLAGYLHDLGLAARPGDVPIDAGDNGEPWHALAGAYLLRDTTGWDQCAAIAALEHHAHVRHGYDVQHPVARAVAVADAYDTHTTARPPLPRRRPHEMVRALLAGAGRTYDPALVAAFVGAWGLFPVGTLVRLDDGGVGVVVTQSAVPDRPTVQIVAAPEGGARGRTAIDLSRVPDRRIVAEMDPRAVGVDPKNLLGLD